MKNQKTILTQMTESNPEFVDETSSLDVAGLNGRLAQLAKDMEDLRDAQEADEALETAKQQSTELGAPYRDGKKAIGLKSRYLVSLLKEKGGA